MSGERLSATGTVGSQSNYALPVIFGAAERTAAGGANKNKIRPFVAAEKQATGISRDNCYENSSSLKDLSVSEILKLAEDRGRVAGIVCRGLTDNPWHKRMAVSADITRRQSQTNSRNHREMGFTTADGQLDDNDRFFDNLMKKMTAEQFMPNGKAIKLRKRTCLWNKENSSSSAAIKRRKENKRNPKSVPQAVPPFARRFLPRQNNINSPAAVKTQSQHGTIIVPRQDQAISRYKATSDLIQADTDMNEISPNPPDYNLSSATIKTIDCSLFGSQTVDNYISTCFEEPLNVRRNHPVHRMDLDLSSSRYYTEKNPKNFWITRRLSTIEEYHEPSLIIDSPVFEPIDMEFEESLRSTPPLKIDSIGCDVCNFEEEGYDDNPNDDSSHLSSLMISGDQRGGIFRI